MNEDRLIRIEEVMHLTGLKESTIYKYIKIGKIPKSIRLSRRMSVWKYSEISQFIDNLGKDDE